MLGPVPFQPSLRDFFIAYDLPFPGTEVPGYFHRVPLGRERRRFLARLLPRFTTSRTFGPSRTPSAKDDSRDPIRTCSPKTAIHHPRQMTHWLSSACLVRAPWVPTRDVNNHRLYQDHGSQSQRSTSSLARPLSRPWTRISVAIHHFPGTVVANHSHAMLGNKTGNKQ